MASPLQAQALQLQEVQRAPTSPASEKPKLALVSSNEPMTELKDTLRAFRNQHRECWLCSKIASDFEKGKSLSEDENWHFTSCVSSWEKMRG